MLPVTDCSYRKILAPLLFACALTLAGCGFSDMEKTYYNFTGTRPSEDTPENRRPPTLNAQMMQGLPQGSQAMPAQPPMPGMPQAGPYDSYASGMPPQNQPEESSGWFSGMGGWFSGMGSWLSFGSDSSDAKAHYAERRPIPGNPMMTEPSALVPPPAAVESTPLAANPMSPHEMMPEQPPSAAMGTQEMPLAEAKQAPAAEPQPETASASQPASKEEENPFETPEKPVAETEQAPANASEPQAEPVQKAESQKGYPALSSVPPTPERFKQIKGEKQQMMEDMTAERTQAAHDKEVVEDEATAESEGTSRPAEEASPAPQEKVLSSMSDTQQAPAPDDTALQTPTLSTAHGPTPDAALDTALKTMPVPAETETPAAPALVETAPPPAALPVAEPPAQSAGKPEPVPLSSGAQEEMPLPDTAVVTDTAPAAPAPAIADAAAPAAEAPIQLTPPETLFGAPTRFLPDSRYATRRAAEQRGNAAQ